MPLKQCFFISRSVNTQSHWTCFAGTRLVPELVCKALALRRLGDHVTHVCWSTNHSTRVQKTQRCRGKGSSSSSLTTSGMTTHGKATWWLFERSGLNGGTLVMFWSEKFFSGPCLVTRGRRELSWLCWRSCFARLLPTPDHANLQLWLVESRPG